MSNPQIEMHDSISSPFLFTGCEIDIDPNVKQRRARRKMTARTVILEGGPPWGFRMTSGAENSNIPLKISRVSETFLSICTLQLGYTLLY